jgi:hypothetical protein
MTLASTSAWRQDGGPGSFTQGCRSNTFANALQRLGVTSIAGRVLSVAMVSAGHGRWIADSLRYLRLDDGVRAERTRTGLRRRRHRIGRSPSITPLSSVSHPHILAVGDLAFTQTSASGPCRMGCATALPMGTAAARTVAALLSGREPPSFEFDYLFRCVSLGRTDGLIQFVDSRDRPKRLVWTAGRRRIWKDYVCRTTLATIGVSSMPAPPVVPPLAMLLR